MTALPPCPPHAPHWPLVGYLVTNSDGYIQAVSPGIVTQSGYTTVQLIGQPLGQILRGPATNPQTIHHLQQQLAIPAPCAVTILQYQATGVPFWAYLQMIPLIRGLHMVSGFVASMAVAPREASTVHLPILSLCAHCRQQAHAHDGGWQRIEAVLAREHELAVSHSICPTCLAVAYAELGLHESV